MSTPELLYSVDNAVATITFNRPEVRNAFGESTRPLLMESLQKAEANEAVGCVVITGAGSAFAAGGDVKSMVQMQAENDNTTITMRMKVAAEIVKLIPTMSKPVIAAINGAAAGAGMNLALACDIRYASDNAIFAESFVKIGLVPDWGGHYLLTRVVGSGRAMELMMLGERINAETALRYGIVNDVFSQPTLMDEVYSRARQLAAAPRKTIAEIKRCVYLGAEASLAQTLNAEEKAQAELFLSDNAREGMKAFVEKRSAKFNQS